MVCRCSKNGKSCKQMRVLPYVRIWFVLWLRIDGDALNWIALCSDSYGNLVNNRWGNPEYEVFPEQFGRILDFLVTWNVVGISPHQIVVLWPDYGMLLVETGSCLCHAPTSSVFFAYFFFNCLNLYVVAISNRLCCSISNKKSCNLDWLVMFLARKPLVWF